MERKYGPQNGERCEDCYYWDRGPCRRHAPRPDGRLNAGSHPKMPSTGWCGEFKPCVCVEGEEDVDG